MKKKSILFALAAVCLPVVLSAQQERKITLNEAIAMARVQSVDIGNIVPSVPIFCRKST